MKRKNILIIFLISLFFTVPVNAQDLESRLSRLITDGFGKSYLENYIEPFSTALGTSLGGGMFHRASVKGFPRFDLGLSAVYIPIPDKAKTFESTSDIVSGKVPTLFGSNSPQQAEAVKGLEQDVFLLPVLQANLGLIGNLEVSARYAALNIDYLGKLSILGGALKYGLSDLIPIPMFPLDFSVQAGYHKFTLGKIIDAGTFSMCFQTSYSVPILPVGFYGGIAYDNSSLTVNTEEIVQGSDLGSVKVEGKNSIRYNAGVSMTFLIMNIHADYNIGEYNSFGLGVMIVL